MWKRIAVVGLACLWALPARAESCLVESSIYGTRDKSCLSNRALSDSAFRQLCNVNITIAQQTGGQAEVTFLDSCPAEHLALCSLPTHQISSYSSDGAMTKRGCEAGGGKWQTQ